LEVAVKMQESHAKMNVEQAVFSLFPKFQKSFVPKDMKLLGQ
jgi:hypothetical protein